MECGNASFFFFVITRSGVGWTDDFCERECAGYMYGVYVSINESFKDQLSG